MSVWIQLVYPAATFQTHNLKSRSRTRLQAPGHDWLLLVLSKAWRQAQLFHHLLDNTLLLSDLDSWAIASRTLSANVRTRLSGCLRMMGRKPHEAEVRARAGGY